MENLEERFEYQNKELWKLNPAQEAMLLSFVRYEVEQGRLQGISEAESVVPDKLLEVGVNPEGLNRKLIYNSCIDKMTDNIARLKGKE